LGGRNKFDVGSAFNLKIQKCIERANERTNELGRKFNVKGKRLKMKIYAKNENVGEAK
jgi:hypothetical protein